VKLLWIVDFIATGDDEGGGMESNWVFTRSDRRTDRSDRL